MNLPRTVTARAMLAATFFVISLFSALAIPAEWDQAGYDATNRGQSPNANGDFSTGSNSSINVSVGWQYHTPIVADIDADGQREAFMVSGSYLQVYDGDLQLKDELALGVTLRGDLVAVPGGVASWYYGSSNKHYAVRYAYTGGVLSAGCTSANLTNLAGADATTGGMSCDGEVCLLAIGQAAGNKAMAFKVNMTSCAVMSRASAGSHIGVSKLYTTRHPSMADIDRDGHADAVLAYDANANGNYGFIIYNMSATPWETIAGKDDISSVVSQPMVYNLDGVGDTEIVMAYANGRNDLQIEAFKPDASRFSSSWLKNMTGQSISAISTPVFHDGLLTNYLCAMGADAAAANGSYVLCVSTTAAQVVSVQLADAQLVSPSPASYMSLASGDMDNDGADELVTSRGILQGTDEGLAAMLALSGKEDTQTVIADLSDDTATDILAMDASLIKAYYGSGLSASQLCTLTNSAPVITALYRDTGNPVCAGQNITFQANIADASDSVRMLIDCDGDGVTDHTSAYTNGSIISQECAYPITGSFTALVTVNDDCLSIVSTTSSVIVSTGVCNNQGEGAGSTGTPAAGASNSVGDFVDGISDATGMSGLFIWLLLMFLVGLAVVLAAVKAGWNGAAMSVVLVFVQGFMIVLGAILGFLGVGIIVVLCLLVIAGLVIWIKDAFGGGQY